MVDVNRYNCTDCQREVNYGESMSRADHFHGAGFSAMFPDETPVTTAPWPQASPSKTHRTYNPALVDEALKDPDAHKQEVDPRRLHASQPNLTRAGVKHYMESSELLSDAHQAGNRDPVVFHDTMRGRDVLLSGHHRAAAALLQGHQFKPVVVSGEPATHREAADYQRAQIQRQRASRA